MTVYSKLRVTVLFTVLSVVALACTGNTEVAPTIDNTPTVGAEPTVAPTVAPTPTQVPPTATPPPTPEPTPEPSPTPVPLTTITDSNGDPVTFEKPPERIVAYDGAAVETLFRLGQGDKIVATHSFVSYPPEAADIPRVGNAFSIDVEAVVALDPDLVYIFYSTFNEQLTNAGLKVLYLQSLNSDFRKTADSIRRWGDIMGTPDEAEALATDFEESVAAVEQAMASEAGGISVFYDTGSLWTPGPDTLVGEVLDLLKLDNVAGDVSGYAQLSPEVIVAADPQVIFTSCPECFTDDPAFSNVRAVADGMIVPTSGLLSIAGPRFVDGIVELAELVYPDLDF